MINNTAKFDFYDLCSIFPNHDILNLTSDFKSEFVTIDSRNCAKGAIFIALIGENTNGHNYLLTAFANNASLAIINRCYYETHQSELDGKPLILCDDTLEALALLAKHHRLRFDIPIIAVGGSNGKTSTKDMIAEVLSQKYNVLKTHANFNNQLGLPLMLLAIDDSIEVGVFEIGTNYPGEMAILTSMLLPTHGILTNIGKEHLELLIDLDGVEAEETTLYGFLHSRGKVFLNIDDPRLAEYSKVLPNFLSYGTTKTAEIHGTILLNDCMQPELFIKHLDNELTIKLNTYGYHSGFNAIAAVAVANEFNLSNEQIIAGLLAYSPVSGLGYGRMLMEKVKDITIINDCYNANPSSMESALLNLDKFKNAGNKIAILGDMLELGNASQNEHINIINYAKNIASSIFLFGTEFEVALNSVGKDANIKYFQDKILLAKELLTELKSDDVILVKGSRGKKMEVVIDYIKNNL